MAKKKHPPDDKEQSARFKKAAREIEADESGEEFARAMEALLGTAKSTSEPAGNITRKPQKGPKDSPQSE